jgi:hypothetical protein
MIWIVHPKSGSWFVYPSWVPDPGVKKAPDPGVKKAQDPGSRIRIRNAGL